MCKQPLIWIFFCLYCTGFVHAQWTAKDSLWLHKALNGSDTIRLNPETMRAIQGGTFLQPETPSSPLLLDKPKLPITKDFSEYIEKEDAVGRVPLKDLPAWVYWWHKFDEGPVDKQISPRLFDFMDIYKSKNAGGYKTPGYDFNHLLSMAFSSKYRRHQRNMNNAKNLRYYNDPLPPEDLTVKRKEYLRQQRELPLPLVTTPYKAKRDSTKLSDSTQVLLPSTSQSSPGPDSLSVVIQADSAGYKTPLN